MSDTDGMSRWLPALLFGLGACNFSSTALPGPPPGDPDAGALPDGAANDGPGGALDDIINVRASDEFVGTADLDLTSATTIDTSTLTISSALPAGVTFTAALQDGLGADLAILHVRRFESMASIDVIGTRALVIIADEVAFGGVLLVQSTGLRASFGATGGGAIEIYARTQLAISGSITVAPSVGQGVAPPGLDKGSGGGGGGGGGAGGEIVLQAPVVSNTGRLTAAAAGASGGDDFPGRIVLLYRTRVDAGITSPTAETTTY